VRTNQLKRHEFQISVAKIDSVTTGASTYLGSTGYAARPARRACDSSLFRDTMPTFETYVPSNSLRKTPRSNGQFVCTYDGRIHSFVGLFIGPVCMVGTGVLVRLQVGGA
jgi:hypothetical protein